MSVVFREPTIWQQYRWHILGTLALVVVQASLIAGLLIEWQHRRQTQERLAERLDFEALVARSPPRSPVCPRPVWTSTSVDCLRRVVIFLGADRGHCGSRRSMGEVLSADPLLDRRGGRARR